eukprot:351897-Chlamydomonas_euryale.AAC.4
MPAGSRPRGLAAANLPSPHIRTARAGDRSGDTASPGWAAAATQQPSLACPPAIDAAAPQPLACTRLCLVTFLTVAPLPPENPFLRRARAELAKSRRRICPR